MTSAPLFRWLVMAWVFATLTALGCADIPASETRSDRLTIAVSLPPQAWLVEQIGGERVDVRVLVKPGASPETFLPGDHEMSRVLAARAYLRMGVPFEDGPWFEALGDAGLPVFDQRPLEPNQDQHQDSHPSSHRGHTHSHGADDPHTWLSPSNLHQQAARVTDMLCQLDPERCTTYRQRAADLDLRLQALDDELRRQLAPYAGRSFLVFHPSWGHFAQAYGLHQVAIEVEGKPPTDAELTAVLKTARRDGLRVVFVQPQVTSRAAEAVAGALGGCTVTLDPLDADIEAMLRRTARALVTSFEQPCL